MLSKILVIGGAACLLALVEIEQLQSVAYGFHSDVPRNGFVIEVQRTERQGDLIKGVIYLNNKEIGKTYENTSFAIPAKTYPGFLRYESGNGHAQGPLGQLAKEGDFLIEIGSNTLILFHGGNKPYQSRGCILLGGVRRNALTGVGHIDDDHPLRIMRKQFYGEEFPTATPAKNISVQIIDSY